LYDLGRCYEDSNRDQLALDTYLDALNVRAMGKAYARAGILYFERREYGLAESYLQKAIGYFLPPSEDALAHYYLGEIYRMQSKCDSSVKMYKKALALDPNLLDAQDGLNRARREICRRSGGNRSGGGGVTPPPASPYTGGGKALKPGEW
jgi:tetratricopeptide (TPR) repeat protein